MKFIRSISFLFSLMLILAVGNVALAVEGKMGDVDGNGGVTAADAASILRSIVYLESFNETQTILGDVDHSGGITAADASRILRAVVKLDSLEKVFEQAYEDFSFIPVDNCATITGYSGTDTQIMIPQTLTGHPVTALAEGLFAESTATSIVFFMEPPEGLLEAGIDSGVILFYLPEYETEWLAANLDEYTIMPYMVTPVSFTVSNLDQIYDGSPKMITATPSVEEAAFSVSYFQNGVAVMPINAGAYQYQIAADAGYLATGDNLTGTFNIGKATYDMSGVSFTDKSFKQDDNQIQYFSLTIEGTLPVGVTVSYWLGSNPFTPQSAKGEYIVTAKFAGDANNYYAIADMTAKLTIENDWTSGWLSFDPVK